MEESIKILKNILVNQNPILFLGAGFSFGAKDSGGKDSVLLGDELRKAILRDLLDEEDKEDYDEIAKYTLQKLCDLIKRKDGGTEKLNSFLVEKYKDIIPEKYHYALVKYDWKKIYTTNIDDLVEKVYTMKRKKLLIQNKKDEKESEDKETEYIKLHGCVNNPELGFVFSNSEYRNIITEKLNFKFTTLAMDIQKEDFIIVGSSFNEDDIEYYLELYKKAGYKSGKGKIIFIDPYPTRWLRDKTEELGAYLIKWTSEQFLNFIGELSYNPTLLQKNKKLLNYRGIQRVSDIKEALDGQEVYESRLYEGYLCNWEDVFDKWVFKQTYINDAVVKIEQMLKETSVACLSIYGGAFTGKSCLLKQIGEEFLDKNYDVLEYQGNFLDIRSLVEYIKVGTYEKYILLIDNASYYYKVIEKLFDVSTNGKKLAIITTSRPYYHEKKKYYLEGNMWDFLKIEGQIDNKNVNLIREKLDEKGYLSYISTLKDILNQNKEIISKKLLINLMMEVTYGKGFRKKIQDALKRMRLENKFENELLIQLAIFEKVHIPYYPKEILVQAYNIDMKTLDLSKEKNRDYFNELRLADYVKMENKGVSLRNIYMVEQVMNNLSDKDIIKAIYSTLVQISPYIHERKNDNWRIIFESLAKEDVLVNCLEININEIRKLYYSLRDYYSDISYYWLQLGLIEQRAKDFSKALSHLHKSEGIKPDAYQIQHAIARNYMKHSNYEKDEMLAIELFKAGEEKMLSLINSKDWYKEKAKDYSIHCYINEKIEFMSKYTMPGEVKQLKEINRYLTILVKNKGEENELVEDLIGKFYKLLKEKNKTNLLTVKKDMKTTVKLISTEARPIDQDRLIDAI